MKININNRTKVIIFLIIALFLVITAIVFPFKKKLNSLDFTIKEANNNNLFETYEELSFVLNDSTIISGKKAVWYLGNGDSIIYNNDIVKYKYKNSGKYLITLRIDDKFPFSKQINVVNSRNLTAYDSIPRIFCEDFGYVGEEVVFSSYAPGSSKWYWEFGETGTIDSYEKQAIYKYSKPGVYTIQLETDKTKYPITKEIEILPLFEEFKEPEKIDSTSIITNDIKKRLQIIANLNTSNQSEFNKQVNYLKKKYFCHDLSKIVIIINEEKYNDFLSYCQGLHYLAGKSTIIQEVKLDTVKCFKEIKVTQTSKKEK
jgi:PKD repeat protein